MKRRQAVYGWLLISVLMTFPLSFAPSSRTRVVPLGRKRVRLSNTMGGDSGDCARCEDVYVRASSTEEERTATDLSVFHRGRNAICRSNFFGRKNGVPVWFIPVE